MKNQLTTITGIFFLLFSGIASANATNYQFDTGIGYANDKNSKLYQLNINYYFSPVETKGKPLAEADFFARQSAIAISAFTFDSETGTTTSNQDGAQLGYQYRSTSNPFILALTYAFSDSDVTASGINGDGDADQYGILAGYQILDSLVASLYYIDSESNLNHPSFSTTKTESSTIGAQAKYVQLNNDKTAYSINATIAQSEQSSNILNEYDSTFYAVSGDYYFNPTLGVSAGYQLNSSDRDTSEYNAYSIGVSYFLTDAFYFEGTYTKRDYDSPLVGDDSETQLSANMRF